MSKSSRAVASMPLAYSVEREGLAGQGRE